MIVWIASYPRTGNKLIRDFLHQVFELPSFSEYRPEHLATRSAVLPKKPQPESRPLPFIGTAIYNSTFQDFYLHAQRSERGFLVKTHHPPLDNSPAIVMTRDGRSALVSYHHFLRDVEQMEVRLSELVRGEAGIGTWSGLLDEWNPFERPATLFLRFEDVLSDPDRVTELVSSFLQLDPLNKWENRFSEMQKTHPWHYRAGKNRENISEFDTHDEELFWEFHHEWMDKAGYTRPEAEFQSAMTTSLPEPPEQWLRYTETIDGVYQIPGVETQKLPFQQRMYRYFYDRFFANDPGLEAFHEAMRLRKTKKNRQCFFGFRRRRAA
jgi:hypothetical protein